MGTTDPTRARLEALRARQAAGEIAAVDVMYGFVVALAEVADTLAGIVAAFAPPAEPEPEAEPTPEA
jgi:predicted NBD/HSP70 family sugar kinase